MARRRRGARCARVYAIVLASIMFGAYGLGSLSPVVHNPGDVPLPAQVAARPVHDPIEIEGDADFTEENGVVSGNGTESDPYLIDGWQIILDSATSPTAGINITNTTTHFLVHDVFIHAEGYIQHKGVRLESVANGTIEGCTVEGIRAGFFIQSSTDIDITNNYLPDSSFQVQESENVSFAQNTCQNGGAVIAASSDVSVTDNTLYYLQVYDYSPGGAIGISDSDNCTVLRNDIWTSTGWGTWGYGISLRDSTNCTIDGNAMSQKGVSISGVELRYFSSHDIGPNNTVQRLPLLVHNGEDGMRISENGFGQLIIVNCTDARVQDMVLSGLLSPISVYFCAEIDINDCVFDNTTDPLEISHSSNVRVRHNTFINSSDLWIRDCSGLVFSDNDLSSNPWVGLMLSDIADSSVERNQFASDSASPVHVWGSTGMSFRENQLPLGGLLIEGNTIDEVASHTIDESNTVGGGKPVAYLKDQKRVSLDLSNYSQVIMVNCSGTTIHGLFTSASWALQLAFATNVTVHDCSVFGSHPINLRYSDGVTLYENDFVNPTMLIQLTMTDNVTIYHCNIIGSGIGWSFGGPIGYTPTNIRWDNGYPDGGNYWERALKVDLYRGPNQDIPGPDGICDRPVDLSGLGVDRYPLMKPYERDDIGWGSAVVWLSAIAVIVVASSLISYLLFVREAPRKPEEPQTEAL